MDRRLVEHPRFHRDEICHTTPESCEQKGRAFWWMMARPAGWDESASVSSHHGSDYPAPFRLSRNFTDPFVKGDGNAIPDSDKNTLQLGSY